MNDKLIEALRTCVDKDKVCSICPYFERCMNDTSGKFVVMVDAADALEEINREYESISKSLDEAVELIQKKDAKYDELLKASHSMHTWIFLNSFDEQEAYDECGLTPEMNALLGYGGQYVIEIPKEEGEKE